MEIKNIMNREVEDIKMSQMEFLKLKNTIAEIKNSPDEINKRLDPEEENISVL